MKFDVHVCLVSGQPTPNLVPVAAESFRPQEVILVVTPPMMTKAAALEKVMRERYQIKVQQIHITNEYDTADIGERLFKLLIDVDKEKVALNTTGGTKLMSIGAYSTFRDAGYPSFYVTEKTGEIKILDSNETFQLDTPKIRIEDYLTVHGYKVIENAKRQINQKWLPIAEELIRAYRDLSDCLVTLNYLISQNQNNLVFEVSSGHLDEHMKYLLSLIERHDLAHWKNNHITFVNTEARDYMAGTWFEEYVFHLVKQIPNVQDCAMSVQIDLEDEKKRGRNELDIAVMVDNTLHILECKTVNFENKSNNEERNQPLYKLETLKKLGGLRTKTALISYRELGKKCDHMKARAAGAEIKILQQKDLQGLSTELSKWLNPKQGK